MMKTILQYLGLSASVLLLVLSPGCFDDGLADDDFTTQVHGTLFFPLSGPVVGGTEVTVSGANFREGIKLFVGGVEASVVSVNSDTTLVATMPPGQYGPTEVTLDLDGAQFTFELPFRYAAAQVDLSFEQEFSNSTYDAAFGSGDFNGDGLGDIVIASGGSLKTYLNSASGFNAQSSHALPLARDFAFGLCLNDVDALKYSLAVLDFSGDGLDDIVVSVYNTQDLYRFEALAGGGFQAIAPSSLTPFDECKNRVLEPVDLDGNATLDLLVINHKGDSAYSSDPEELGSVGIVWNLGSGDERSEILQTPKECSTLHSWAVNRQTRPNSAEILCAQGESDDQQSLYSMAITPDSMAPRVDVSIAPIGTNISSSTRYHFIDFEHDGDPELAFVHVEVGERPWDKIYTGGLATRPNGVLETLRTFDLSCESAPPKLLLATLSAEQPSLLLFLCREGLDVQGLFDTSPVQSSRVHVPSALMEQLATPDFTNTSAAGIPSMPSAAVFDLNRDGWSELLLQRRGGKDFLVYGNRTPLSPESWHVELSASRATGQLSEGGTHRIWSISLGGFSRRIYDQGIPSGPLVDLNGDGTQGLVLRSVEFSGARNPGISLGSRQVPGADFDMNTLDLSGAGPSLTRLPLPLIVEDLNGDGIKDFVSPYHLLSAPTPEAARATYADFLLSDASGNYVLRSEVTLSAKSLTRVRVLKSRDTSTRLVATTLNSTSGNFYDGTIVENMSVVELVGSAATGFRESSVSVENLNVAGGVYELVDLDQDGIFDLVSWDGKVCYGDDWQRCVDQGFEPVFGQGIEPGSLRLAFSQTENGVEFFALNRDTNTANWATLKNRKTEAISFVLNSAWNLDSTSRGWEQGKACDLNGDGLGELLFTTRSAGQLGWNLLSMQRDAAGQGVIVKELARNSSLALNSITCAAFTREGLHDLVIVAGERLIHSITNRSQ